MNLAASCRIPLWLKVIYTLFTALVIVIYTMDYGPTNFLYFCDVALIVTVAALWTESALLASVPLVLILVPQLIWMADFLSGAIGYHFAKLTEYMFEEDRSLFMRGLSFFHFWLPWLLVYLVWKLGFDRRAWIACSVPGVVLLLVCYFFMPEPPPPTSNPNLPVNINYVYGMSDKAKQTVMDQRLWFGLELLILPFGIWLPTFWVLSKIFRSPAAVRASAEQLVAAEPSFSTAQ